LFAFWEGLPGRRRFFVLNKRQRDFAEYYIQCGNASEAAKKAGYSERTARSIGQENLTKPDISAYIAERMEEMRKKQIATSEEVVIFFTSVLRGEEMNGEIPAVKHRLEAGKELLKRFDAAATEPTTQRKEDDPLTKALREEAERLGHGGTE
jgi:phage terminase small subunit